MTAAFASLLFLQIGAAFSKTIFPLVGPEGVAALRIGITALVLGVIIRPWRVKIERSSWINLLIYGGMIGLMNILIYRAFLHIPVGIAISIEVLGPLGMSLLLSKRKSDLVWITLALSGVMLLPFGLSSFSLNAMGVLYAILAAITWGIYISFASKVSDLGAGGVSIGMILASLFVVPLGLSQVGVSLFQTEILALGLVVAILSSTLPFLLDAYALKSLPKCIFGILMSASPAVSAIAGWLILNEQLSSIQFMGILAISIACIGTSLPAYLSAKPSEVA